MQFEVKDLINKIKKDGVEEAEKISSEIISKAKQEAENIILNAKSEAETLKKESEKESDEYKKYAFEASKQAVRDLIIGSEKDIKELFESTLKDDISKVYDDNFVSGLILKVVDTWLKGEKLDIFLSENDISNLEAILKSKLGNKIGSEIELKPFKGIDKGFKIQKKDSNLYYDFTASTISEILFQYLNPRFKEVVKI